jgi:AcrR family transcriptional regulator
MGLREKKAQRNRERIVSEALALFAHYGYEQTTMESIAEAAELSPSTLYRYFPSKDLIVLQRFLDFSEQFARVFAEYSQHHPVDEALAEAIFAVLEVEDGRSAETLLVRSIIDEAPIARARLWDYLAEQQRQLGKLIAQRQRKRSSRQANGPNGNHDRRNGCRSMASDWRQAALPCNRGQPDASASGSRGHFSPPGRKKCPAQANC